MKTRKSIITLCEAAICVALSLVLSFIEIPIGLLGGAIDFTMIPLIIFAVYRGGAIWGIGAGAVYGTIYFIFRGGSALTWTSIILDYIVAYGAVGFAGLWKNKAKGYFWGALVGCFARFVIHFISGITIYAIVAPTEALGITTSSVWLYSFLYNIAYMGPNTIIALIATPLIGIALSKSNLRIKNI